MDKGVLHSYETEVSPSNGTDRSLSTTASHGELDIIPSTESIAGQSYGLWSSQIWRDQLRCAFLASYYSSSIVSTNHEFIDTYYRLAPRACAMKASQDALCLIHLGTRFRDEKMLNEGQKVYCTALSLIREEIGKPHVVVDDSILGACYTLAHCEVSCHSMLCGLTALM